MSSGDELRISLQVGHSGGRRMNRNLGGSEPPCARNLVDRFRRVHLRTGVKNLRC